MNLGEFLNLKKNILRPNLLVQGILSWSLSIETGKIA